MTAPLLSLTDLWRYPVKSMRGESVASAAVEPWGLAGDRRWMLVDEHGDAITARECAALVLLRPVLTDGQAGGQTGGGLRIAAAGHPDLVVDRPDPADQTPVALWGSHLTAARAGDAADAWLDRVLGRPARLVWLDDPTRRPTSEGFGDPGDLVSLADGYPLLLTTAESLAALDEEVPGAGSMPVTRFRPNVVVAGAPAWAEDDWRRIRIGAATFRAVKGCARCVLTTVDPATGERGKEPIASLARIRRFGSATWFGINLVPDLAPDAPPVEIAVGDDVEVLDAVEPGGGPLRSLA